MGLNIFLTSTIFVLAPPLLAEPCSSHGSPKQNAEHLNVINDVIEESPFLMACKEPEGLLKNRPKTGLKVRAVIEGDAQGHRTEKLLEKLIAKVRVRISESKNQISNIRQCLLNRGAPYCAESNHWATQELPKYLRAARFHLSLAQSQHEVKTWVGLTSRNVNDQLNPLGSYKKESWIPLNQKEKKVSERELNRYLIETEQTANKKIKEGTLCQKCREKFIDEALLAVRFQHYQAYHQLLSQLKLMQYLREPKFNAQKYMIAFRQMEEDLNAEAAALSEQEKKLKSVPLDSNLLTLLNYNTELEEILMNEPEYCGLAASLVYNRSDRELGNSLAVGLPVLAASFFAGPTVIALGGSATLGTLASVGTGVVSGAGFAYQSYADFKETQMRTLGHIYGDAMGNDLAQLESAKKQANDDALTLPTGFGLGGMLLRRISVGENALEFAKKVFLRAQP